MPAPKGRPQARRMSDEVSSEQRPHLCTTCGHKHDQASPVARLRIMSILEMRKVRRGELKQLAECHSAPGRQMKTFLPPYPLYHMRQGAVGCEQDKLKKNTHTKSKKQRFQHQVDLLSTITRSLEEGSSTGSVGSVGPRPCRPRHISCSFCHLQMTVAPGIPADKTEFRVGELISSYGFASLWE